MSELLCEDDGELLDEGQGDLDAILGGVSEAVYENTVSVAQLKSVTGPDLVREVRNYMASYQGTGDGTVDLGRTMQMLKMSRKGYQVQAERRRKRNGKGTGQACRQYGISPAGIVGFGRTPGAGSCPGICSSYDRGGRWRSGFGGQDTADPKEKKECWQE